MINFSVKPVLLSQNKKDDEFCMVSIRVSAQRQHRYKKTGHKIPPMYWDAKTGTIKKKWPNSNFLNADIQKLVSKINAELLYYSHEEEVDIDFIEAYLKDQVTLKKILSFSALVKDYAKEQSTSFKKSTGTTDNYIKHLNKFAKFLDKTNILINDITVENLRAYESYLVKQKNNPSTIWDCITKFFTKFVKLSSQRYKTDPNLLQGYEFPKYKGTNKEYLVLQELDAIENVMDKLTEPERIVAHYFLVECYSGIRFGDWKGFKIETLINEEGFKVRANKNGQPIYLSLQNRPRLKRIIDKIRKEDLVFNFSLEHTNRLLKGIVRSAGITKKVSTHTGRHTCATLYLELGHSNEYIAELLGITLKTVQVYAKTTRTKMNREDLLIGGL